MTEFCSGVMKELVMCSTVEWNTVNRETKAWLASPQPEVPLLLRGVFVSKPDVLGWVATHAKLADARQRWRTERFYANRRDYMREYMRERRASK